MSDETGNSDSERLGVDNRNFFDDPLVGFKVEGQFSVIFFNDDPGGLFDCLCSYHSNLEYPITFGNSKMVKFQKNMFLSFKL